jgi:hypothetical protein
MHLSFRRWPVISVHFAPRIDNEFQCVDFKDIAPEPRVNGNYHRSSEPFQRDFGAERFHDAVCCVRSQALYLADSLRDVFQPALGIGTMIGPYHGHGDHQTLIITRMGILEIRYRRSSYFTNQLETFVEDNTLSEAPADDANPAETLVSRANP